MALRRVDDIGLDNAAQPLHLAEPLHPAAQDGTGAGLASPYQQAPRFLLRDRDRIFGREFVEQVEALNSASAVDSALAMAAGIR